MSMVLIRAYVEAKQFVSWASSIGREPLLALFRPVYCSPLAKPRKVALAFVASRI